MTFPISLNGWRRIGIVFMVLWFLLVVASLFSPMKPDGLLMSQKTRSKTMQVPAPELQEQLEQAKREKLGRDLKPWEMEWNPQKTIVVQDSYATVSALKFFLVALVFPVLVWLLLEGSVLVIRWIRRGFATK